MIIGGALFCGCYIKQHIQGQYYIETKNYEQGILSFKEELGNHPDDHCLNYFLGRFYLAEKKPKAAIQYLKHAARPKLKRLKT